MVNIFYSYAHEDEEYKDQLEKTLTVLRKQKIINDWSDRRIAPGSDWEEDINTHLEMADIILLMVSNDFILSDYCYDTETVFALEQHENKEAKVIPIILRPCLWQETNFKHLQVLPKDGEAISLIQKDPEVIWVEIAEKIAFEAKEILKTKLAKAAKNQVTIKGFVEDYKSMGTRGEPASPIHADLTNFFDRYNKWYFSPLRIQKWGGKKQNFTQLKNYSTSDIKSALDEMVENGEVKAVQSKRGNPIYKLI